MRTNIFTANVSTYGYIMPLRLVYLYGADDELFTETTLLGHHVRSTII